MKQVTFSTDLIYDVLLKHEPDHILLTTSRYEVERHLLALDRLKLVLDELSQKIIFKALDLPLSAFNTYYAGLESRKCRRRCYRRNFRK